MVGYFLAFGLGYLFGSGGKIPGMPTVTQNPNGTFTVTPQTNPGTTPQPQGSTSPFLPQGYTMDSAGNVYDARGVVVGSIGQLFTGLRQPAS